MLSHSHNQTLRHHLADSGCHTLADFILPSGAWPNVLEFHVLVKDRVPGEAAVVRNINFLYKQLTQIVERLFPAGLQQLTRAQARAPAYPWSTWSGVTRRHFPHIRSSAIYASLLPNKQPRRPHHLLRHQVDIRLDPQQLTTTLRHLQRYIRPRVLDITLRAWWRMLPVNYFFWRNGPPEKRRCSHSCDAIETYQHLFWDCRIARDAWSRMLKLWRPLLYTPPTWPTALFGIQLVTLPHDRHTRPGTLTLWQITRSVMLYELWTTRNAAKHRGEQQHSGEITFRRACANLGIHLRYLLKHKPYDDDMHDSIASKIGHLNRHGNLLKRNAQEASH